MQFLVKNWWFLPVTLFHFSQQNRILLWYYIFDAFFGKKSKIVDYFLFSLCLNKKDFDKSSFFEYSNFFTKKENDLDAMCHGFYNGIPYEL